LHLHFLQKHAVKHVYLLIMFYYCFKHFKCNFDCVLSELIQMRGRRVRDHMVVGFTTKYAISDYHN